MAQRFSNGPRDARRVSRLIPQSTGDRMPRQLKGNPSIISRPNQGVRKFSPGRTKCSRCGEALQREDDPRPGAGRAWRHGRNCPADSQQDTELNSAGQASTVAFLGRAVTSGTKDLWEEIALSIEFEPMGLMAQALTGVLLTNPEAPGVKYLNNRQAGTVGINVRAAD